MCAALRVCCGLLLSCPVQLSAQQRKVEQLERTVKSQTAQINGHKEQMQALKVARQQAQDNFEKQLKVQFCMKRLCSTRQHTARHHMQRAGRQNIGWSSRAADFILDC